MKIAAVLSVMAATALSSGTAAYGKGAKADTDGHELVSLWKEYGRLQDEDRPDKEEEVLEKAAGHLEGSSLPSGGENTHAVISAHRGLPSAALFTDLDQLEAGDHFLIRVLDETLCYEVDQIETVEPDDTSALAVEEGEDLVTLLTCTPYGVNSHRLLVRGHRVPYEETVVAEEETPLAAVSIHTNYLLWVFVGLGVTALFILALYLLDRRAWTARQKEREEKEES